MQASTGWCKLVQVVLVNTGWYWLVLVGVSWCWMVQLVQESTSWCKLVQAGAGPYRLVLAGAI